MNALFVLNLLAHQAVFGRRDEPMQQHALLFGNPAAPYPPKLGSKTPVVLRAGTGNTDVPLSERSRSLLQTHGKWFSLH